MWKGRTFQLFFVWLIALELILGWENFKESKITKLRSARTIAVAVAMILPTLYVAASFNFGLNNAIFNWSTVNNIKWASSMPLSTEYLAFTGLFCLVAFIALGRKGLLNFSIPAVFMGIVGAIYTIDNVFPYGQFTPFQFFVQPTAYFAERVLNFIGYQTSLSMGHDIFAGAMPTLSIATRLFLLFYRTLSELDHLLYLELACEGLMHFEILAEHFMHPCVRLPGSIEGILGLYAHCVHRASPKHLFYPLGIGHVGGGVR